MTDDGNAKLRAAVERVFSDEFLFHRDNRAWRHVVVSEEGDPLDVDAFQLGSFSDVAANASFVPAAMVKEIAAAVKDSTVVEVRTDGDGNVVLKRKAPLQEEADPELRTVFAKPIHYDATEDQIREFFSRWGTVQAVERRQYLAGAAGTEKVRPSTFITFSTRDEAAKCIAARPSYGKCDTELGSLFVPQLTVTTKEAHDATQSMLVQRGAAMQLQKEMVSANKAGHHQDTSEPTGTKQFLRPRCTCKVWDLKPGVTWQTIKAKLGNLAISHPALRKKIGLVHAEGDHAYVVCKTPEAAQTLLVAYASASKENEEFSAALREVVPRMTLLEGKEEEEFIRQYPALVGGKVQKKVAVNQKRARE